MAADFNERRNDQIGLIERRSDAVTDYDAVPDEPMRTDAPGKERRSDRFPVWIELAVGPGGGAGVVKTIALRPPVV